MYDRAILHMDLDAFFVSVEVLRDSKLKGKPVIIGGTKGRGVVASCSYEARRFGVHAAMPMKMALRLCPDAIVRRGDMDIYTKVSKVITEVISSEAPLFEKASIDEFYLDLTGMDRHFGAWKWSKELKDKIIRESGLPISIGMAINKLVSKVSVGVNKPNAEQAVDAGLERAFLNPLPVKILPQVGKKPQQKLSFMGVHKVETLAEIPKDFLEREFGKHGTALWRKAHAIDNSPVVPYTEQKSMGHERTFQVDTINVVALKQELTRMIIKLGFELRKKGKLASVISVKIRYTDFDTHTKQKRIPYTASDKVLIRYAHELFEQLYKRRQLLRLVGVKVSGLTSGHYQISLFEDSEKDVKLLTAMDRIKKRFGAASIMPASIMKKK